MHGTQLIRIADTAKHRIQRWTCPAVNQTLIACLFIRLLSLIYLAAFASLATQILGLFGQDGILPLDSYLANLRSTEGVGAYWQNPTLFWINDTDTALQLACLAGVASSVTAFSGYAPRISLAICYLLYLSLACAGQDFLSYQWDMLLLECGFLALLLPDPTLLIIGLFRFLLFRYMLMSGIVKLASGEPAWWNLTALRLHLETQPLPSPLAWNSSQIPGIALQSITALVLFLELVIPFLVLLHRRHRIVAAAGFLALQTGIALTGNFAFFNLLSIALCIFLLDDRNVERALGTAWANRIRAGRRVTPEFIKNSTVIMACLVGLACLGLLWMTSLRTKPPQPLSAAVDVASALNIVNGYGPFAVINKERLEIILEGSRDGESWQAYAFRYKPDQTDKPLRWNIPHQPRLDWQFWFAALGMPERNGWFPKFMERLKQGSPEVLALLGRNPFGDLPPTQVRARLFRYRFATPEQRAETGRIWQREEIGPYDYAARRVIAKGHN